MYALYSNVPHFPIGHLPFALNSRRITVRPSLHTEIEARLARTPAKYYYTRLNVYTELLPQNSYTFESQPIFPTYSCAPLMFVVFQSQTRSEGSYKKSIHKLELPGGHDTKGSPRLQSIDFLLNNNHPEKYVSVYQNTVVEGALLRNYTQMFRNLNAYYTDQDFHMPYSTFMDTFPIFCFNTSASSRLFARTLPLVKTGSVKIALKFREPTPNNVIQKMIVYSFSPSVLTVDHKRVINLSYRTS